MTRPKTPKPKPLRRPHLVPPATPTTIADLTRDPANFRRHTPRNLGMITDALKTVGAARSIVIDETNQILAGDGVAQGAPQAGITKLKIVDVDGDTLVAVRRSGLTPEQKLKLALYDNRAPELAEWDDARLKLAAADGLDLQPFFTEAELTGLASLHAAADVVDMARGEDADEETGPSVAGVTTLGPEHRTFSCPLTVDEERRVRAALRLARVTFQVTTTGAALVAVIDAWSRHAAEAAEKTNARQSRVK
jgi:hypothetical protein